MLTTRTLFTSLIVGSLIVRCGGTSEPDDGGADALIDSPVVKDAGKDGAVDAAKDASVDATADVASDVTVQDSQVDSPVDAPIDVTLDSPIDAPIDAPADAVLETGTDAAATDGGTISAISGLVLWLDAAKGVTTNNSSITAWADQSSKANDASGATAAPTLVSSSINSLPAAHFVATSSQQLTIADATSLQFGTGDFYIAVVSKFDNNPTGGISTGIGTLFAKLGTGSGLLFFANDFTYPTSFAAGLCNLEDPTPTEVEYAASYNDGTARLYVIQRTTGTEYLRVNGAQVATSSSSIDVSEVGSFVAIGAIMANEAALDGDIAEMIVVGGTLATSDRTTIESYLQSKYGL